jgi:hypothetical protein
MPTHVADPSRRTDTGPPTAAVRLATWACALGLAVVGFWFRVGPARPIVLPEGEPPRLLGTDASDHLRRAAQLSGALPAHLTPRPAHPDDWVEPGLFDAALALTATVAGGSPPGMEDLVAAGIWMPPVLVLNMTQTPARQVQVVSMFRTDPFEAALHPVLPRRSSLRLQAGERSA